jgi:hypothetical protein
MRVPFSPYHLGEFLSMVGRRFSPPPPRPPLLDQNLQLRDATTEAWMGFVGDVCPLFGRTAQFGEGVKAFLSDCEVMIGNFEGVFSDRRWKPFLMKHSADIFGVMAEIQSLDRWVVSVANNHATDYGPEALHRTLRKLDQNDIRWMGTADRPRLRLTDEITLTAWTWWLNRRGEGVARRDPGAPTSSGLHVAAPHWGYEHERTPRPSQTVPEGYDLTVGHHTHLPQPFEHRDNGQLVAWSLGNFVTGKQLPVLGEGALLKVGVAHPSGGPPKITRLRFREIDLDRDRDQCRVTLRNPSSVPYADADGQTIRSS